MKSYLLYKTYFMKLNKNLKYTEAAKILLYLAKIETLSSSVHN